MPDSWLGRPLFSYADLEKRILGRHLFRKIRQVVNDTLPCARGPAGYAQSARKTGGSELSALSLRVMGLFAKTEILVARRGPCPMSMSQETKALF
ncbi:hypothetical protein GIY56_17445 [Paracoccus sp. YIM 132242]|uniref:Uncharacterized protein n=1 Tax=Paracoccus lichenicola TaxID=2665644 RepID=A0A6L6HSE3_9RHOB|nr:hypothetical protein [Paracoccus lichenicola]